MESKRLKLHFLQAFFDGKEIQRVVPSLLIHNFDFLLVQPQCILVCGVLVEWWKDASVKRGKVFVPNVLTYPEEIIVVYNILHPHLEGALNKIGNRSNVLWRSL